MTIYRFDIFQLNAKLRVLQNVDDGQFVSLTPKIFDTLLYLVENRGQLVGKDELLEAVWPNVVVEESNLTHAISVLRRSLGEQPREHRFIVTAPGQGYRFVADVQVLHDQGDEYSGGKETLSRSDMPARPGNIRTGRWTKWTNGVIALVAIATFAWVFALFFPGETLVVPIAERFEYELSDFRLVSEAPGDHQQPTLSPDGSLVAYSSDASGVYQIWVKNLAQGNALQITDGAVPAFHPAWSPQGDQIIFERPGAGIWTVGSLGSPRPRQIIERGQRPGFSPDGTSISYRRGFGEIWLANEDGTERREVKGTPAESVGLNTTPSISPDGSRIAFFAGEAGPMGDIWTIPTAGGEARRLTFDRKEGGSPIWTPDGESIIYASSRSGTQTLWQIPAEGGASTPLTTGVGEDDAPALSSNGIDLVYSNVRVEWNLIHTDPETGRHDTLFTSRSRISFPKFSPDGQKIVYFAVTSNGVHIFVINSDGGETRQVTFEEGSENIMPRWSSDGQSIYYYNNFPDGSFRKISVDGGRSELVFENFRWETYMQAVPNIQDDAIAFAKLNPPTYADERTLVWDVETRSETELSPPHIHFPAWSADGLSLLGWRHDNTNVICPVSGEDCQLVSVGDGTPVWSGDQSRIFFRRLVEGKPRYGELWVIDRSGHNERKLLEYGPLDIPLDQGYDVSPDDTIVWIQYNRGNHEVWTATLSQ